jgi:hypothetical protein
MSPTITIRLAEPGDTAALARLAALDSARPPRGATLMAEVEDEPWAALPLDGGQPIADPFRPTVDLIRLLELRAGQLGAGARRPSGTRRGGSLVPLRHGPRRRRLPAAAESA